MSIEQIINETVLEILNDPTVDMKHKVRLASAGVAVIMETDDIEVNPDWEFHSIEDFITATLQDRSVDVKHRVRLSSAFYTQLHRKKPKGVKDRQQSDAEEAGRTKKLGTLGKPTLRRVK